MEMHAIQSKQASMIQAVSSIPYLGITSGFA